MSEPNSRSIHDGTTSRDGDALQLWLFLNDKAETVGLLTTAFTHFNMEHIKSLVVEYRELEFIEQRPRHLCQRMVRRKAKS